MSSSPAPNTCFNPECRVPKSDKWRKGWRLRNSDFANLCDRCGSIYEYGRFCETFHKYASGWRSCETCGKRVHCGCIVSIHAFVVLDAGGVECIMCSRKSEILTFNPMWPPRPLTGRVAEGPTGNWNQVAGPRPSGSWTQADNIYNRSVAHSDLALRTSFKADGSTGFGRLFGCGRSALFPSESNGYQNLHFSNGGLQHNGSEMPECGKRVFNHLQHSCLKSPVHQSIAFCPALSSQAENQRRVPGSHSQQHCHLDVMGKIVGGKLHDGVDSSHQPQIHNGKLADVQAWKELPPQYFPRMSDEVLQHISGVSNSVITPLFEKMLSASDTGRIGRLVLPKKCAEIYFPAISQPEGLPLKVQDIKGKEWIFQFRFWPNNNSRMYVLEGITNCIQSLQLQAGDVVTFSRVEPEGKLIMGFRKASTVPQSDQSTQASKTVHETRPSGYIGNLMPQINENLISCRLKGHPMSECHSSRDQLKTADAASVLSKTGRLEHVMNEAVGTSSSIPSKRKNAVLCSKKKCLKFDNVDFVELTVTFEEAQGLFRAPTDHAPNVVIIEDVVFEEYEDAPVIGRPTVIAKGSMGEDSQWAQCDNCLKWRKLPSDSLLPARWTCSQNPWDPNRSSCDAVEELTSGQFKHLSSVSLPAASGAMEMLVNSAVRDSEANPDLTQLTSKHPHHKTGCFCIVCNQPSSGKERKDHHNWSCNACPMAKQKQQPETLVLHHGRNQLGKEVATQKPNLPDKTQSPAKLDPVIKLLDNGCLGYVNGKESVLCTPMKGQIDLNVQPEREEEAPTCSKLTKWMALDARKVNPKSIDKSKLVFGTSSGGNSGGLL